MNCTKKLLTRTLLAVIWVTVTGVARASDADEPDVVAVTVRYDDLDLNAPADVATLKRRLSKAAGQVCAVQYVSDPIGMSRQLGCIQRATDKALAQVNWPGK